MSETPFVHSVFHPSDFSASSYPAFVHALAIALYRQGELNIAHLVPDKEAVDSWQDSPGVRATLERWGVLDADSPRSAIYKRLSMDVSKINVRGSKPLDALLGALLRHPADLIVLSTEKRLIIPRWLKPSLAEQVARAAKTITLFVPTWARGFVSEDDGRIALKHILVPVDHNPNPAAAVTHAMRFAVASLENPVKITLLRVGGEDDWPVLDLPSLETCEWDTVVREGNVVDQIVKTTEEIGADLVVMATAGAKGTLGALRGSVTDQVLRRSPSALLAVPDTSV